MRAREIEKYFNYKKVKIYFEKPDGGENCIVGIIDDTEFQWGIESNYSTIVLTKYGRFSIPNRAILDIEEYD